MEIRLQKYFTDCGVLSRRTAEAEIAAGRVRVNGEVAQIGTKIDPATDTVTYKGKVVEPKTERGIYVMLNKPRGYVTTLSDDRGRKCITELIADIEERIYPVGRLDMDSDGLLLLTNDGELTNFLTHPKHEIPKIYHVKVKGKLTPEQIREIGRPIEIDGMTTKPVRVTLVSTDRDNSTLEMVLYEGRNRQIRRMCEARDVEILRLCRVAIGNITLGNLTPGKWRYLSHAQVEYLKNEMRKFNK
ncbi:MAG: rRNA pseudouridine synthase [Clostridia bacterium]|nr:rRNA pseudouridine synthase [Clostridia bacterium]